MIHPVHQIHRAGELCGQFAQRHVGEFVDAVGVKAFTPAPQRLETALFRRLYAQLGGEAFRPAPHQKDVRQLFHHLARQADDVAIVMHAGHRAGAQRQPVHDTGVEFHVTEDVGQTAVAHTVFEGIVLDDAGGDFNGVERAATVAHQLHGGFGALASIFTGDDDRCWVRHGWFFR